MRVLKFVTLVAPLAVVLSAVPGVVYAHGGGACRQDIQQFCPNITPGPGTFKAYQQCLEDNAANLSAPCKQERSQWQAKMQQTLAACTMETSPGGVCASAGPDPGAIIKCLHQHHANLSQACSDQLPRRRHHHHHGDKRPAAAS